MTSNYKQALRLAEQANHFTYGDGADPVIGAASAAEAQVYATLALVDAVREAATTSTPITEQACACSALAPLGNGRCYRCGHTADDHGPHNGHAAPPHPDLGPRHEAHGATPGR